MILNVGDVVEYRDLTSFYEVLEVDLSRNLVTALGLLDRNKKQINNLNGEHFTIKSVVHGWKIGDFTLVESRMQGPLPKYYNICQKIKAMDKRFKERKVGTLN